MTPFEKLTNDALFEVTKHLNRKSYDTLIEALLPIERYRDFSREYYPLATYEIIYLKNDNALLFKNKMVNLSELIADNQHMNTNIYIIDDFAQFELTSGKYILAYLKYLLERKNICVNKIKMIYVGYQKKHMVTYVDKL